MPSWNTCFYNRYCILYMKTQDINKCFATSFDRIKVKKNILLDSFFLVESRKCIAHIANQKRDPKFNFGRFNFLRFYHWIYCTLKIMCLKSNNFYNFNNILCIYLYSVSKILSSIIYWTCFYTLITSASVANIVHLPL